MQTRELEWSDHRHPRAREYRERLQANLFEICEEWNAAELLSGGEVEAADLRNSSLIERCEEVVDGQATNQDRLKMGQLEGIHLIKALPATLRERTWREMEQLPWPSDEEVRRLVERVRTDSDLRHELAGALWKSLETMVHSAARSAVAQGLQGGRQWE